MKIKDNINRLLLLLICLGTLLCCLPFAALVNELANYKYINREDDMGLDGLRQAKLSYHPSVMVKNTPP